MTTRSVSRYTQYRQATAIHNRLGGCLLGETRRVHTKMGHNLELKELLYRRATSVAKPGKNIPEFHECLQVYHQWCLAPDLSACLGTVETGHAAEEAHYS